jgi:hypothetical protein
VENVTIYDSFLDGEYLGWHSKNLRLVNCHIGGEQPLCYAHDLVLENCTFDAESDRAFEYSTVQADIRGSIKSVKNPASGRIVADAIGEIILDENIKGPADCEIIVRTSPSPSEGNTSPNPSGGNTSPSPSKGGELE